MVGLFPYNLHKWLGCHKLKIKMKLILTKFGTTTYGFSCCREDSIQFLFLYFCLSIDEFQFFKHCKQRSSIGMWRLLSVYMKLGDSKEQVINVPHQDLLTASNCTTFKWEATIAVMKSAPYWLCTSYVPYTTTLGHWMSHSWNTGVHPVDVIY